MSLIEIATGDGAMAAYLARPAAGRGPAIVVIQEIFGVNQVMRGVADWLASEGFLALTPDLFWRLEPGVQLTDKTPADWQRAIDLMNRFDVDKGIADLGRTVTAARGLDGATGRVGALGYCLGGKLAFLAATRTGVDAAVGYYGIGLPELLGEAGAIAHPLMLHIARRDQYAPPSAQRRVHEALDRHPQVTLHDYAGQNHAFARSGGEHYDKSSADLANDRTLDFFRRHLK